MEFFDWLSEVVGRRGWWNIVTEVGVPTLVGIGSIVVAVASWRTSRKATKIASDAAEAERKRDERAVKREEAEVDVKYEQRLTDACADLLAGYSDWQLERYKDPIQPPTAAITAGSRALMFAHSKDRQVLLNAMAAIAWSRQSPIDSGVAASTHTELLSAFSSWRWGSRTAEETADIIRAKTYVDDSWRPSVMPEPERN